MWVVSGPNTSAAPVCVQSLDGAAFDVSNARFTIADPYSAWAFPTVTRHGRRAMSCRSSGAIPSGRQTR
jgi:hypothetical protein